MPIPKDFTDIRRNRVAMMREEKIDSYIDVNFIKKEVDDSKVLFKKYNWPTIDVTRKICRGKQPLL